MIVLSLLLVSFFLIDAKHRNAINTVKCDSNWSNRYHFHILIWDTISIEYCARSKRNMGERKSESRNDKSQLQFIMARNREKERERAKRSQLEIRGRYSRKRANDPLIVLVNLITSRTSCDTARGIATCLRWSNGIPAYTCSHNSYLYQVSHRHVSITDIHRKTIEKCTSFLMTKHDHKVTQYWIY